MVPTPATTVPVYEATVGIAALAATLAPKVAAPLITVPAPIPAEISPATFV